MTHPLIATIPDDLLDRKNAVRLERWCVNRGFRPTLLDIEVERRRRGLTGSPKVTPPKRRKGRREGTGLVPWRRVGFDLQDRGIEYLEFRDSGCHGDRDGDCSWKGCPQLRDGEPVATGRHCPLDEGGRR